MSHDFLISYSQVAPVEMQDQGLRRQATVDVIGEEQPKGEGELHRTVGISMSPQLRERATKRANEIGLSLSRYVQWCIEAEIEGQPLSERLKNVKM